MGLALDRFSEIARLALGKLLLAAAGLTLRSRSYLKQLPPVMKAAALGLILALPILAYLTLILARSDPTPTTPTPANSQAYIPYLERSTSSPTPVPLATPSPTAIRLPTAPAGQAGTPAPTVAPPPPGPTATPEPRPIEKVTKMGVGVYTSGGGHIVEALMRAKPTVILLMEPDPALAREIRKWFPKAFIVGRRHLLDQSLDNPEVRGEQVADYVAQLALPLRGVVDAWMSYNEVVGSGDYEAYRAYNRFQVAFARRLQGAYGIPAIAANDGVGVVAPEDYARLFAEAIQESQYFGIHAYAPKGAPSMREQAEWYALRYRKIHEALVRAGVRHGPIILTETGLWDGWRGYTSEEAMAQDFEWLSDEMEQDPYVIGQAIFALYADGRWKDFEIAGTSILDRIGDYTPRR